MPDEPSSPNPVQILSEHPRGGVLAEFVLERALDAAASRRADFASRWGASPSASVAAKLSRDETQTGFGNVYDVLERGVESPEERVLVGALLAIGVAKKPQQDPQEVQTLASNLVWLAAHTPCDALNWLDAALGDQAGMLWEAIARVAQSPARASPDFDQTEALVAAAALCRSSSETAYRVRLHLAQHVDDPVLGALLRGGTFGTAELNGELDTPPLSTLATVLLSVTLLLFVMQTARLVLRVALAYRRPARLILGETGIDIVHRTELMGKVLRERSIVVPFSNLARITREVRYARLGLYAGLIALTLGTYFGMGLFVDGVRVPGGSPPLLGMAVLCIVAGLAMDFVLSTAANSARGRCRIVIEPRRGRALCVNALEPVSADALLSRIAETAHGARSAA